MTGERQMGKSDDEGAEKGHTGKERRRDGAKAESCEEDKR